jgi:hypothetical protein
MAVAQVSHSQSVLLNGSGTVQHATQPTRTVSAPSRVISASSRRKMALAQQARWAKIRKGSKPVGTKSTSSAPVKRTMSAAARKRLSAFQKARWQKIRAQQEGGVAPREPAASLRQAFTCEVRRINVRQLQDRGRCAAIVSFTVFGSMNSKP